MRQSADLAGRAVFISASIPDPNRWQGDFDPLEITDAVTAAARAILTASGMVVAAAHPTIAPLLLYLAAEFPATEKPGVIVYQSHLFDKVLPEAIKRFQEEGTGEVRWIEPVEGDAPQPGLWNRSLERLRRAMLEETQPAAGVFIGGMEGVPVEHSLFTGLLPDRPWYALGRPGGAARELAESADTPLQRELLTGTIYPSLFRLVVAEISQTLGPHAPTRFG
jgi:hypothetical protein